MSDSPLSVASIQRALAETVPAGKRGALVVVATNDGVHATFAARINDVWQLGAQVEWHGEDVQVGVSVKATW